MTTPTAPPSGNVPGTPPAHDPNTEFSPRTKKIMGFGVLIAIFGAVAVFIVVKVLNPPAPAYNAGDCIEVVSGGHLAAKVEKADCGAEEAIYKVGVYLDDTKAECPEGDYATFKQSGGKVQNYRLCLVLNAAEGDCLDVPMIGGGQEVKAACTAENANVKVTKVIDGKADKSGCPAEAADNARVYSEPKQTFCLARNVRA